MKAFAFYVVFFIFSVLGSYAQQTNTTAPEATNSISLTIDGTTYNDVRWGRVSPSTVTIFHRTGVATVPLAKLSPDLQTKFGYDPQNAAQWEIAQRKAEAAREAAKRQQQLLKQYADTPLPLQLGGIGVFRYSCLVFQVLGPDEMLVECATNYEYGERSGQIVYSDPFCIKGLSTVGLADGQTMKPFHTVFKVTGTKTYDSVQGANRTVFVLEPYSGN